MVLESTVVCIDNGEFMRNGDFIPTRMQAQIEAANLIIQCKLRGNPENVVGILSMAPKTNVQVGLTQDSGKLINKLHQVPIKGYSDFVVGVKTAQLVLKLRRNRNHKPRIIVFVGSPIEDPVEDLIDIAKKLKKDKFQIDVISFGEAKQNDQKLDTFVKTINGSDTGSHLVTVPGGASLQEVLIDSAVLRSEDGAAPAVTFGAGGGFEFGVDANEDPELAMALRVSLEEQRQRQEQQARQAESPAAGAGAAQPVSVSTGAAPAAQAPEGAANKEQPMDTSSNIAAMTEEEQMELALRMSMLPPAPTEPATTSATGKEAGSSTTATKTAGSSDDVVMNDPKALEELLNTLPGVDTKSAAFRKAKEEAEKKKKDNADYSDKKDKEPKKWTVFGLIDD